MPTITQYEASRAITGKLKKEHLGLPAGTVLSLSLVRSYLNRPRYLGGRLCHDFDARLAEDGPAPAGIRLAMPFRVTDAQLEGLVLTPRKG